MVDRPIIFSAPMVQALLAGRKTQTRRRLKPQPYVVQERDGVRWWNLAGMPGGNIVMGDDALLRAHKKPAVGDRLWVREAWKPGSWREDGRAALDYQASPELTQTPWLFPPDFEYLWIKWTDELIAAGSTPDDEGMHHWAPGQSPLRYRPSIHMPRWASRLTLTVTDVRVQRLQEISEADARAEGMTFLGTPPDTWGIEDLVSSVAARRSFWLLWNQLHGAGAWEQNPHVVALTFTVEQRNIDA